MPYHYDTRNLLWFSLQRFLHLFGKYTNRFSVVCPIAGLATARRKKPPKPIPQITRWESTLSETQLRPLHVWIALLGEDSVIYTKEGVLITFGCSSDQAWFLCEIHEQN